MTRLIAARVLRRVLAAALPASLLATLLIVPLTAPTAAAATSMDSVRRFAVPASTLQVVLVRSTSWASTYARVEFFERTSASAPWVAALPAQPGRVGYSGMVDGTKRIQGSGKTPAGIYALPSAFGGAANPGTALPYRRIDGNDWWPADPKDPSTYNVFQTSRSASARWRTSWAEHLLDYYTATRRQYAYSVILDYNLPKAYQPPNTRLGGGIFLHVSGSGSTAGCVSLSEPSMISALRWLKPASRPVIVTGPTAWLDDAADTTARLSTVVAPTPYQPVGTSTGFAAVARPARLQWWRFTVTNACTGATVASSSGQSAAPVSLRWPATASGRPAPPGLYRLRIEAGTTTSTAQAALSWPVEVFANGTTALAGCAADRVSGADRYATAVAVAQSAAPGARSIVLASGENAHLVDSLVAGPLAASTGSALLLTATGTLPVATSAEIRRRAATSVTVVGSSGAVADAVLKSVRALGVSSVRRLSGATRYDTAAAVAREMGSADGSAFVASGADPSLVDGLAASGPAAHLHRPILLTAAASVPAATAAALQALGVTRTDVIGSAGVVSDAVLAQLPAPTRLGGATRYETAANVAEAFSAQVGMADVVLASGAGSVVDALPGGTLGRLVLLTGPVLPAAASSWLSGSGTSRLALIGGPSAVTPAAAVAAVTAMRS